MNTLFVSSALTIEMFKKHYSVNLSIQFIDCADIQLTRFFEQQTGLKVSKHVCISLISGEEFYYKSGVTSTIPTRIFVNHNWNPVTVHWKSKSGRIYTMEDADIDCDDIQFWFEGLNTVLYHKQLYPNEKLPFKLKALTYELVITRLVWSNLSMDMHFKDSALQDIAAAIKSIDDFIDAFNDKSESLNRKYGVVHNWKRKLEENKLVYEIDTGSGGYELMRKLLPFLSGMDLFSKVEIW